MAFSHFAYGDAAIKLKCKQHHKKAIFTHKFAMNVTPEEVIIFRMTFLSPYCDFDLEDRNPNFSYDTPSHDDTPTYQVSLRKVKWFRRYHPDKLKYFLRI